MIYPYSAVADHFVVSRMDKSMSLTGGPPGFNRVSCQQRSRYRVGRGYQKGFMMALHCCTQVNGSYCRIGVSGFSFKGA